MKAPVRKSRPPLHASILRSTYWALFFSAPLTCACSFFARPHVEKSTQHMQDTLGWTLAYPASGTCSMSTEEKAPYGSCSDSALFPLHLLWNSAFVNNFSDNSYVYNAVTEGFLQGAHYNTTLSWINGYPAVAQSMLDSFRNQSLVLLPVTDCIKAYGNEFVSEYSNLLLVYGINDDYNSLLLQMSSNKGGSWMCGNHGCVFPDLIRQNATSWNPCDRDFKIFEIPTTTWTTYFLDGSIKYCLAEKANTPCRLGVSLPIMVAVLGCNVVKIVCFIMTLLVGGSMYPLVTNGDAVQSSPLRPDSRLQRRWLVSKSDVDNKHFWSGQPLPRPWRSKRRPWAAGATISFWLATFIPYATTTSFLAFDLC
jgi:hypothetical protein